MKKTFKILILVSALFASRAWAEPATLVQVTDSLGNVQTNSLTSNEQLGWPEDVATPVVIEIGDKILFTATGSDPENEALEFRFAVQGSGGVFQTSQDWSSSNQWEWNVSQSDFGPNILVLVAVRDGDGFDFQGSFDGDDYTYLTYDVRDPNGANQATIDLVEDSLGNRQTNSLSTNQQLDWPENVSRPVLVNVGDTVSFTVTVGASSGEDIQYMFSIQPPGGSFELLQDWSASNTVDWLVPESAFGPDVTVLIAVRNGDGLDVHGEFGGDDYTYAVYSVEDASASLPPIITEVSDSYGRSHSNSFGSNQNADWSSDTASPVIVSIGQTLTISVQASDPDNALNELQYKFDIQRVGGSFESLQDWSSESSFDWEVTRADYGREVTILVAVRDADGKNLFGEFSGDDYTYMTYRATVNLTPVINSLL